MLCRIYSTLDRQVPFYQTQHQIGGFLGLTSKLHSTPFLFLCLDPLCHCFPTNYCAIFERVFIEMDAFEYFRETDFGKELLAEEEAVAKAESLERMAYIEHIVNCPTDFILLDEGTMRTQPGGSRIS